MGGAQESALLGLCEDRLTMCPQDRYCCNCKRQPNTKTRFAENGLLHLQGIVEGQTDCECCQ